MDENIDALEAEYCPPIDPALFSAIVLDFDLSVKEDLENVRATLDSLKDSALLEEAAGFDASGTGGLDYQSDMNGARSKDTDLSTASDQMSSLDLEDDFPGPGTSQADAEALEMLDHDTKLQLLEDVFGKQVSRSNLEQTLQKCNGKWNAAMDEILNQIYLGDEAGGHDEPVAQVKGIDGFFEDSRVHRNRKGKPKDKRLRKIDQEQPQSVPRSSESSVKASNKWKTATEDVEFVASRTGIKSATVSSMYNEMGASLPETIAAVIRASKEESKYIVEDEAAISSYGLELEPEFPAIPPEDLVVLVRLTYPSLAAARELATALTGSAKHPTEDIRIIPRYSRPLDIADGSSWSIDTPTSRSTTSSPGRSMDSDSAAARRERYDLARAAALAQAKAARRKAKSNHLMNGAVAVYNERGREYAELSANASAQAADELASFQSSPSQVDLHGVDVYNAVRIAREKVEKWWEGLGESRVNGRAGAENRNAGYRIIVGVGKHSEGGKGKLGPAISKMLREQGWRFEPATSGVIVVKGPLRR